MDVIVQKRNERIDIIKGFGIILMVLGHSGFPATHYIYLFHMAIFFIMSGGLYQDKYSHSMHTLKLYCLKKMKSLYIPFLSANLLFTLLNNFFITINIYTDNSNILILEGAKVHQKYTLETYIIEILKTIFMIGGTEMGGALWFLRVLLIISLMYASLDLAMYKIIRKNNIRETVLGVIAVIFLLCGYLLGKKHFNLNGVSQALSFFILYFIGKEISYHPKIITYTENIIGSLLSCIILIFLNTKGTIALDMNQYENPIFLLIASCAGYVLINNAARYMENCILKLPFLLLGQHTMEILIWHFLSFKIINLLGIYLYHYPFYYVAQFPILLTDGLWWLLYLLAGIGIPITISTLFSKKLCHLKT